MTKEISTTKLSAILAEITSRYLDCKSCPVERNCCIAKGNYKINFKKHEIKVLFDVDTFSEDCLPMNLKLGDKINGDIIMQDMACPKYGAGIGCTLHDEKKKLNLITCMQFPICALDNSDLDVVTRYLYGGLFDDILCVNVNYYCYSVEKNWSNLAKELISLSSKFDVPVEVIYISNDGVRNSFYVMEFDEKLKEGIIPSQDGCKGG